VPPVSVPADVADRSRQPCDGGAHASCRGLHAQIAVDVKHKLFVEQQVTNQVLDMGEAGQRFRQA
jgi:hypothetical protein